MNVLVWKTGSNHQYVSQVKYLLARRENLIFLFQTVIVGSTVQHEFQFHWKAFVINYVICAQGWNKLYKANILALWIYMQW